MTNEFLYMLEILKSVIHSVPLPIPQSNIDWDVFQIEAVDHCVLSIVFRATESLSIENRPPAQHLACWKSILISQGVRSLKQEHNLKIIIERFEDAGIRVLLFKGPVLAALYPHKTDRFSTDIDILVDESSLQQANDILESTGYFYFSNHSTVNERTYSNGSLSIELHTRLWEEDSGERHTRLMSLNIGTLSNAVEIEACGILVWTMSPQETLVYLFYHMIKHFFVCGIGVRYLCDIVLYIKQYQSAINWSNFWDEIQFLGYSGFVRSFLCLCQKYMGLSSKYIGMQRLTEAESLNAEKILSDMADGGHNGRKTAVRHRTGRILRIYYENESLRIPNTNVEMLKRIFLPTHNELTSRKTSNRVTTKFTPIAWIHNLLFLLERWKETKGQRCTLRQRIICARKRLSLLKKLDLID